MKKRFMLLIVSVITVSLVFTGCKKTNNEATKTDTKVETNVEQKPTDETKIDEKKEDVKPQIKGEVKTDAATTQQKTVISEPDAPATSTANKTTTPITTTSTKKTATTVPSTSTIKPTASTPASVQNKPSGFADINNAFRSKYFLLEPSQYTGDKVSIFDTLTLDVARGALTKAQAIAKLNSISPWTESKTNVTHEILNPTVTVYTTSSNDLSSIMVDLRNKGLFTGDSYSNSYVYYDASIKQNRIVMVGIGFITKTVTVK